MSPEKNGLEALRAEYGHLSSRITRLSLVLISALIIVTFTITNGLDKVDVREFEKELDAAKAVSNTAFKTYQDRRKISRESESRTEAEDKEIERLGDAWMATYDKQRDVQRRYDALLKEQFSISPSILGSDLKFDLRSWVYGIPFAAILGYLYIQILRKKQRTVLLIGSFQRRKYEDLSELDHLTFSEDFGQLTEYARSPSQLEEIIYLVIVTLLISIIVVSLYATEVVLLGLDTVETFQYLLMIFTASWFAAAYYFHKAARLDAQTVLLTAAEPKAPRISIKIRTSASRILTALKPRISLTTGALLVIASLFLSTSASCDGPLPGHELLRNGSKGFWITSIVNTAEWGLYWKDSVDALGRITYVISLVLAVVSLVLIVLSFGQLKLSRWRRVHSSLFLVSTTLSLVVITDFSFTTFWFKDEIFLLSNLFWIVPSILVSLRTLTKTRSQEPSVKAFLIGLILPLLAAATVYVCYVTLRGYRGVLAYFVGMNLISVSYLHLVSRNRRDSLPIPSANSVASDSRAVVQ